jgi:hypothetical protein
MTRQKSKFNNFTNSFRNLRSSDPFWVVVDWC